MQQLELFENSSQEISINKPIKIIELFAGYGSQSMALDRLGVKFEYHVMCEFDKYAVKSFNAVHGTNFPVTDIRNLSGKDLNVKDCNLNEYIMTYSFPCTDLSVAGKMAGMSKKDWESGKSTRSGLLWEVERLLRECKDLADNDKSYGLPQVLLLENVPQIISKKNYPDFQLWLDFLTSLGYSNYYKILNATDYGVAQHRTRFFMVSLLGDYSYKFPDAIPLNKVMLNYLDDEVDEKFFVRNEKASKLIDQLIDQNVIPEIENE